MVPRRGSYARQAVGFPLAIASAVIVAATALCLTGCCIPGTQRPPAPPSLENIHSPYVTDATDATFAAVVLNSDKPVLVDFWAEYCIPCRYLIPAINELAEDYHEEVAFVRLNSENNQQTAIKYQVQFIPLLLIFHNGEAIARHDGLPVDESQDVLAATRRWMKGELEANGLKGIQ